MAVMQTPHGRVVGLILPKEDQPIPKAVEKEPEVAEKTVMTAVKPQAKKPRATRK